MNDFARLHRDYLIKAYTEDNYSLDVIAKELGTYKNKVKRALVSLGVKMKDKSEAQKLALSSGRHKHPTEGTTRDEATKIKISETRFESWQNISDKERKEIGKKHKKAWENLSEAEQRRIYEKGWDGVRKASVEGSKMEKLLQEALLKRGYEVIFHKKGLIDPKFEVDFFLPIDKIIIEIDGPSHFLPIWGEEKLVKTMHADAHKNGLLIHHGFVVIRVKQLVKKLSQKRQRDLIAAVTENVDAVKANFPPKEERFIEIEIS